MANAIKSAVPAKRVRTVPPNVAEKAKLARQRAAEDAQDLAFARRRIKEIEADPSLLVGPEASEAFLREITGE